MIELEQGSDTVAVSPLQRRMNSALLAGHRQIVIGLPAQTPIDNHALVTLCATVREATAGGAELRIVGADRRVRQTLELCQLDGLEFFDSITRALARSRAGITARVRLRWRGASERPQSALNRSSSGPPS